MPYIHTQVDLQYIEARNALIPQAKEEADLVHGSKPKGGGVFLDEWNTRWNSHFHCRMNELAKEAGLT